ncbi:diguanylate cyclase [Aliivibrio sp. 1S165]|uniref:diguanylate cyclase domain-containing protein n=1 Tax=unclassified Aliivibrio TaxID=2645654 RepID=UPI00080E7096|nr:MULTISPECIES: diguanylate cyclase [unclassified Aliivibrio]OCH16708.1 diguanylate cyclase [Aliivibrio sp. 1S165]OCH32840.1 diguanylate cyclase [Aliivibrio sp. 1S175]
MIHLWFSSLPLRKKVIYPIWTLLTLSSIILGASVAYFVGVTHSANLYTRTSILAQGIASNLSGALIFNDKITVLDQMNALSFDPEIIAAYVEDINKESFATLDKLPMNCQWVQQNISCNDSIFFAITQPITLENEHLGNLTVWASKDKMFQQRNQIITVFLFITVLLSSLALFFAHRLHRLIAMPLLSIFHSMQSVIKKGVTNQRLSVLHSDELGMVTRCFNEMLDNLSHRDNLLTQAFQHLEDKNHYINQVLDSLEQGLLVVSPNKKITYYNPAAHQLLSSLTVENINIVVDLDIQFIDIILSSFEPKSRLLSLQEHIKQHQRLDPIVLRHQLSGKLYQISTYPIAGDKNSLIHVEDISNRYLAEQRQRMAEMIFDQNPISAIVLSRKLNIETKNNAFIRIFGQIDNLNQLYLREPIELSFTVFKKLLKHGFLNVKTEVSSLELSDNLRDTRAWLPCLITITTIKNSDDKVESFIISISDQTQELELKRLSFEANHDALTGLANKKNIYHNLLDLHKKGRSAYILFIDLDGFKAVNDTYGHQSGDALLKIIAQRLTNCVYQYDLVARLSGDEFLLGLYLPNERTNQEYNIHSISQHILEEISQPIIIKNNEAKVSASIGVYYWDRNSKRDLESALQQADEAMYHAKLLGKNRYHLKNGKK